MTEREEMLAFIREIVTDEDLYDSTAAKAERYRQAVKDARALLARIVGDELRACRFGGRMRNTIYYAESDIEVTCKSCLKLFQLFTPRKDNK